MKVLIYSDASGSVCVETPTPEFIAKQGGIDAAIAELQKRVPAGMQKVRVIDNSELPDRSNRNAWVDNGSKISVDPAKIVSPL